MAPKPKPEKRPAPELTPDSVPDAPEVLPDDLRRRDQPEITPDSLPSREEESAGDSALGAHSLAPDGGVAEHPIHDEPEQDFTPDDYEKQIDKAGEAERKLRHTADQA